MVATPHSLLSQPNLPSTLSGLADELRPCVDAELNMRLGRLRKQAAVYEVAPTADALRDLVMRGGKRYRAMLAAVGHLGTRRRGNWQTAVSAGVALELLHAYLLVQDDWMDGDQTRRGGPSVHVLLGRAYGGPKLGAISAILSGDMAWGLAVDTLSSVPVSASRRLKAQQILCEVHQEVLLGQQIDVLAQTTKIEQLHALKTSSYTVRGPLLIGASLAGATDLELKAIDRFARPLGVAFQLRDDLLGVFGEPAETGKPLAGDLRRGKRTAVTVQADEALDAKGRRAYRQVYGVARASTAQLRTAIEHLERCGVRRKVEKRAATLCRQARTRIDALPLRARGRQWLNGAVAMVDSKQVR